MNHGPSACDKKSLLPDPRIQAFEAVTLRFRRERPVEYWNECPLWVGNGLLPQREFLKPERVKPSAGDHRATSACWNPCRVVASAVSDGIAS